MIRQCFLECDSSLEVRAWTVRSSKAHLDYSTTHLPTNQPTVNAPAQSQHYAQRQVTGAARRSWIRRIVVGNQENIPQTRPGKKRKGLEEKSGLRCVLNAATFPRIVEGLHGCQKALRSQNTPKRVKCSSDTPNSYRHCRWVASTTYKFSG